MFVAFTVAIYALIGWLSRTVQVDAYYVAGRQVPTVFNGMATAADWMSGASFVALAGGIYFGGYTYMAFLVGWTGGYVLVSTLLAPYLRKFDVTQFLILLEQDMVVTREIAVQY